MARTCKFEMVITFKIEFMSANIDLCPKFHYI